jgi:peptidoglycan/xylan/chitin deacetylase (PgdA/CDA1 family)
MDSPDPRIAVVMITWNRKQEVLASLERLTRLPERPSILVVDNGSTDGTIEAVAARFPQVKVLCMTYDDGPGPDTLELGRFLFEEQIPATFFVIGRYAEANLDTLARLQSWGHRIGNHTWRHPGLVALARAGGDMVGELEATDRVIRPFVTGACFFRAPYGNWREKQPDSDQDKSISLIADVVNRRPALRHYVGPVNWDIVAEDWECWRLGVSAEECARRYLEEAKRIGSGIVLMHDSSEDEELRRRNRTMQMTKFLVPRLKAEGFRFVDLAEVPQVRSALRVSHQVSLETQDGRVLMRRGVRGEAFRATRDGTKREAFGVVELGRNRAALRAGNGLYLSAMAEGTVRASATTIGDRETLTFEGDGENQSIRGGDGRYLSCVSGWLKGAEAAENKALRFTIHRLFS